MSDMAAVVQVLTRLGNDPQSSVYLEPPADEAAIAQMQAAARRDLGQPVPEAYVTLLQFTNGLQMNGAYFKSAEHLVAENLDLRQTEVIVLGTAGNVSDFVYDSRDQQFHTTIFGFRDERLATFGSLATLLTAVMREQQIV
jgi:hypothetical protein